MSFRNAIVAAGLLVAGSCFAPALASDGDSDSTPVPMCINMPTSAVIQVFSKSDAQVVCRAMGMLDGVRVKDIRAFSKAVSLLSHYGYEGSNSDIAKQLVQIVRLRGLYDQPDRWYSTLDIVMRAYQAFNGVVAPSDIVAFLRSSGPSAAKSLSDQGFTTMLAVIKEYKQQGHE